MKIPPTVRKSMQKFWSSLAVRRILRALDVVAAVLIRTTPGAHLVYALVPGAKPLLCSNCLKDIGLRFDAEAAGIICALPCPQCGSKTGKRLTKYLIDYVIFRFFVRGSVVRHRYGSAPWLQYNTHHFRNGDYQPPPWLQTDLQLLSEAAGIGVFHYGPRFWMLGEVEPLKRLEDSSTRAEIVEKILQTFPTFEWAATETLFRLRVNPRSPNEPAEYDSPPLQYLGKGRLDSPTLPVLYCSQDIEGSVHECRVTVEDECYVATFEPTRLSTGVQP